MGVEKGKIAVGNLVTLTLEIIGTSCHTYLMFHPPLTPPIEGGEGDKKIYSLPSREGVERDFNPGKRRGGQGYLSPSREGKA